MSDSDKVERIVAVAIRHADGEVFSLPPPNRHHNVIWLMSQRGKPYACARESGHTQGFLTNLGRFVDRYEARVIAARAEQLREDSGLPQLYSEDVW